MGDSPRELRSGESREHESARARETKKIDKNNICSI